ncbi:MAG: hypothetical protein R6U32_03640 [Candidatus Woesearchaeota archaeon]
MAKKGGPIFGRPKKKKGLLVEAKLIKLILLIFSFILLFSFIYRFYAKSTEHADEEACRNSLVMIQTLAEKTKTETVKPWPRQCKTEDKEFNTQDPEKAKRQLADLMSWCWYMVGEGAIKPFDSDWLSTSKKCFICYTVRFPYLKEPITPRDFLFFLQDEGRKETTYYNYLKYEEDKLVESPLVNEVNSEGVYSVVYSDPGDKTAVNLGFIGGATKEDVVYVANTTSGVSGCIGPTSMGVEIKTDI